MQSRLVMGERVVRGRATATASAELCGWMVTSSPKHQIEEAEEAGEGPISDHFVLPVEAD